MIEPGSRLIQRAEGRRGQGYRVELATNQAAQLHGDAAAADRGLRVIERLLGRRD
jgi:hypothetical protein